MSDYAYDRENVVEELEGLADVRLSGPTTLRVVVWDDSDFQATVFHTIDATYPHEAAAQNDEQGRPFYRERLTFSTSGPEEGWICHEVVRRRCGETGATVVHAERVGGYTFNWPAPLENDDDEDDGPTYPGSTFPGRFA
ncbi:hypothetical protein [Halobellus rufus]|uniref:hypothetical protein n=1 Tax=Halobellus rufus TaxID=1448860 RepID=UPI000679A078|nr:hypothetical protein [Halobellus rufus]